MDQLNQIVRDALMSNNLHAVAQQLTQPLRTRLLHEPLARGMLVVDTVAAGDIYRLDKDFDVPAYMLSEPVGNIPEVIVESDTFIAKPFTIAAKVSVSMQEIQLRAFNVVDNMILKAKDQIKIEEDRRFFKVLDAAVPNGPAPFDHVINLTFAPGTTVEEMADQFRFTVNSAAAKIEEKMLRAERIIMNPAEYRKLIANARSNQVDFITAREHMMHGYVARYMGLEVYVSPVCPEGNVYILTSPEYLGRMPIWQDVTVIPDPSGVSQMLIRFIILEQLNMIIHNPKGVVKIVVTY